MNASIMQTFIGRDGLHWKKGKMVEDLMRKTSSHFEGRWTESQDRMLARWMEFHATTEAALDGDDDEGMRIWRERLMRR